MHEDSGFEPENVELASNFQKMNVGLEDSFLKICHPELPEIRAYGAQVDSGFCVLNIITLDIYS